MYVENDHTPHSPCSCWDREVYIPVFFHDLPCPFDARLLCILPFIVRIASHKMLNYRTEPQANFAADVADKYCDGEVRLTVDEKLLFPNVDTDKVHEMIKMPFFQKVPLVGSTFYWYIVYLFSCQGMQH